MYRDMPQPRLPVRFAETHNVHREANTWLPCRNDPPPLVAVHWIAGASICKPCLEDSYCRSRHVRSHGKFVDIRRSVRIEGYRSSYSLPMHDAQRSSQLGNGMSLPRSHNDY